MKSSRTKSKEDLDQPEVLATQLQDCATRRWSWSLQVLSWGLFLTLFVVFFWGILFGEKSFGFRDAGHYYFRLFAWTDSELSRANLPLWNPYDNAGVPHLADASSSLFYPGKLIFHLRWLDYATRYNLYLLLHLVWAAGGMARVCARFRFNSAGTGVAILSFCFGGIMLTQTGNAVFLVGAAWFPWAISAIESIRNGERTGLLRFAFVIAMMILGGDPQMGYHAILVGFFMTWRSWFKVRVNEDLVRCDESDAPEKITFWNQFQSLARRLPRPKWRMLGLGIATMLVIIGLTAIQVFPTWNWSRQSTRASFQQPRSIYEIPRYVSNQRSSKFGDNKSKPPLQQLAIGSLNGMGRESLPGTHQRQAYDFSVPPWTLVELGWPNVSGKMYPKAGRWIDRLPSADRVWNPSLYVGAIPFLLAIAAFTLRRKTGIQSRLSWLLVVSVLASFGWYGIGWIVKELVHLTTGGPPDGLQIGSPVGGLYWFFATFLPGYAQFRYPAKWLVLAAFAISTLAGAAISNSRLRNKVVSLGYGYIGLSLLLFATLYLVRGSLVARLGQIPNDPLFGPFQSSETFQQIGWGLMQGCIAVGALVVSFRLRQPGWVGFSRIAVLGILAIDLAIANHWIVVQVPKSTWQESESVVWMQNEQRRQQADLVPVRFYRANFAQWNPPSFSESSSEERYEEIVSWDKDTLFPKHHLGSGFNSIDSYGSITAVDWAALLVVARSSGNRRTDGVQELPLEFLDTFGTRYLLYPEPLSTLEKMNRLNCERTWIGRVDSAFPRAWWVEETRLIRPPRHGDSNDMLRAAQESLGTSVGNEWASVAVVEDADFALPTRTQGLSSELSSRSAVVTEYQVDRVVIEARGVQQPAMLILSDYYSPGWRATLTDLNSLETSQVKIARVNRVMRGIKIPPGDFRVEYKYQPAGFQIGLLVSMGSWLLFAILFARRFFTRPSRD